MSSKIDISILSLTGSNQNRTILEYVAISPKSQVSNSAFLAKCVKIIFFVVERIIMNNDKLLYTKNRINVFKQFKIYLS